MDASKTLEATLLFLKRERQYAALGATIWTNFSDLLEKVGTPRLMMTLKRLEKDFEVLEIIKEPLNDANYDPFDERPSHYMDCFEIKLVEKFDNFVDFMLEPVVVGTQTKFIPPFIQIMLDAVQNLEISPDSQLPKKTIEAWLEDHYPQLSGNDRSAMATFMRDPEKKKGDWREARQKKAAIQNIK